MADHDEKVQPAHYTDLGEYQAIYIIQKWKLDFCLGNAVKYIQRAGEKPGESEVADLKKAIWYIERRIFEIDPTEPDPAAVRKKR
jgi:hypothetical protein